MRNILSWLKVEGCCVVHGVGGEELVCFKILLHILYSKVQIIFVAGSRDGVSQERPKRNTQLVASSSLKAGRLLESTYVPTITLVGHLPLFVTPCLRVSILPLSFLMELAGVDWWEAEG